MEAISEETLGKNSQHQTVHSYNTRSKSDSNSVESTQTTDGKSNNIQSTSNERVIRSRNRKLGKGKGGKGNRKRNFPEAVKGQKASPNKPPSKSCRNVNSNTSLMEDQSVSTLSKVRYSNSTSSLTQDDCSAKPGQSVPRETMDPQTKGDYPVYQSSSNISNMSFSTIGNISPWALDISIDDANSWVNNKKCKNREQNFLPDGEGCSEWQPRLITRLTDIHVPSVPRNKVMLNYNPDGSIELLGEGEYGYVVRGILKESNRDLDIVAKYFKKDRSSLEDIMDETRIQQYLQDTRYVPIVYGLIDTKRKDCDPILIQECFGGGLTLDDLLDRQMSKQTWLGVSLQVAIGLSRIHQKGVLVNDIKLDNILVDCQSEICSVRFIDMGIATFRSSYISGGSQATMAECTHLAPEVRMLKPSSPKSDIYGLGYVVKTIGEESEISELITLGCKLMAEKPVKRYSLPKTINKIKTLLKRS